MTIKEMRVSDLAKKTGLTTKELLVELKKMGSRAGSPSSAVETSAVKQILARHKKETTPADTEKKAKKTTAKKKAPAKVKAKTKAAPKAAKKPAAKKTVAVKKTAKKKVIKAASKKQEAAPLAAPLKKRVLIKKRVAPPAPVAAAEEETRGEISAEALTPASPDTPQVPPVLEEQAVPGAAPSSPVSPAGLAETTEAPSAVKQPGEAPKEAVGAAEEDKGKKKTLKTDLFQQAKEELSSRMRQRGKKAKKPVRSKENAQSEPQFQLSSWRDIRPTTSRRTFPQKKAGPPSDLAEITKPRRKTIKYTEGITVKEFAEVLGQKATDVIRKMMELGTMAGINQPIDSTAATMVAEAFDLKVEAVQPQSAEDVISEEEVKEENLQPRPPVVTIMGHVDHGKTSLLDAIRSTEVAEGEAGGITQHIGAYTIKAGDRTIAFLDTPGHEAFTAMRARGAQVTDIVVLVVAADDGVMPQTVEAINHARAAEVPIIVAINKIDKPEADLERVRRALSEHELVSESWGGETIFVEVSAKKRLHLDKLLEMILLQADVLELKADPTSLPRGVVVEAKMDKGRGPVATILVQSGTLKIGDSFVAGACFGRVRALVDDKGKKVKKAGPSEPVEVVGLLGVPQAGDTFVVVEEEKVAREIASTRQASRRTEELSQRKRVTLDDLYSQIQEGSVKELKIVLRGDVQGSVEALIESMNKLSTPEVKVIVIHNGVGGITESDVLLASASNAIIIGFNVRPESKASALAEKEKVDIRNFSIIYEAIEEIRSAMEGLLEPTFKERVTGRCEIRQVFNITKAGAIAGAYVTEGTITRGSAGVRILRDSVVVYEGKLGSLKRFKEDVREVQSGYECGIGIENFNDIKTGDVIEAFVVDEVATKL